MHVKIDKEDGMTCNNKGRKRNFFIFVRWIGARKKESGHRDRQGKSRGKMSQHMKEDVEICLENISWHDSMYDLKCRILKEYGVLIEHQQMSKSHENKYKKLRKYVQTS